ncbi:hypothetical protein MW290_25610 [Aquincola tertiaricarbonis]|uniref:Peptidase S24/S26A/S26B/S26C domain-containing protein n=2 Tax=Aquincola tertiaricarbonis TaxID=391953 RepID=A0ABY4S905_AQUTE|nr:hypothetical protein MW290_25610 [Aquincola tertiaricarbonis]
MDAKTLHRKAKLRELVARHDGPAAFGRIIGKTRSYVSQLMSEDYPGGEAAFRRLADAAGLPSSYFDTDDGERIQLPKSKELPLLQLEEVGSNLMNHSTKTVPVALDAEGQFAVRLVGDSMVASSPGDVSLPSGTIVVVNAERKPMPGNIVVARLDGSASATVRQLIEDSGFYYLRPMNNNYSRPKVTLDQILGVVTSATVPLA